MPSAALAHLQRLLALIGAALLRTGVFSDEGWMLAPPWLIRRVRAALAFVRAHLHEAAMIEARRLYRLGWRDGQVIRLRPAPRPANLATTVRASSLAIALTHARRPALAHRRDVCRQTMARMRARLALLTTVAFEDRRAHERRITRLARTLIRRLLRPKQGVSPRPQTDAAFALEGLIARRRRRESG